MSVKNLSVKNFDGFIKIGNNVVEFGADWCIPCKILKPNFEKASEEIDNVKFWNVDVDEENKLAQRFNVMSVPTLIFFKDNEQIDRMVGAISKEELVSKIKKVFKK